MAGKKKASKKSEIQPPGKEPSVGSAAGISEDGADLRRRAEDILLKQPGTVDKIPLADVQRIVHELQVYQIELEMQNDELRRTQQELEAAREKYFDLYDLAPAGYVSLNEKGIILEANLTAATLLGVERSKLVGHPLVRFVYMEDQDIYYLCHKQLMTTRAPQSCIMRMVRNDNVPFWVRLDTGAAPGADDIKGSRAIIIDVSERKRIEEKLKKSEKRYHSLFENMSEGSAYCKMLYDNNGNPTDFVYLAVNSAFGRLTGLHNVVGKNVTEVIPGIKESHPELFEIYSRVALTGQPEKFEIEFKPLAAWLYISVYSTEKNYFVAIFDNITERKQKHDEMQKARELADDLNLKLEAANKELEAFNYSVSHDLRAPLRHMSGFAKMLQKKLVSDPDEKTQQYMASIIAASKKMGMLIDDLLSFSHIGRTELQMRKVSLDSLLKEVVSEIKDELKERQVRWEIDELPDVLGDRSLLRLVMVNLVSNAVKFTSKSPQAEIKIGCNDGDDKFTCSISDNGVGFDMKYANKLFGVFQRLHSQEEFEGTGIGLANVQRIISRHGGRVWAEGAEGQGATFYFTLSKIK
jgi:PAS domain S-box-containing protein